MERKKVFFVLHYLAGGGTERVVVRILHSLDGIALRNDKYRARL